MSEMTETPGVSSIFVICPKCRTKNYKYFSVRTDEEKIWILSIICTGCRNDFRQNIILGRPTPTDILNPKFLAEMVKKVQKELSDEDVSRFRVK